MSENQQGGREGGTRQQYCTRLGMQQYTRVVVVVLMMCSCCSKKIPCDDSVVQR